MFTATEAIAALDDALALAGQTVTLRRFAGTTNPTATEATVPAGVRHRNADEAGGGVGQGAIEIVLSPSALAAEDWAELDDPLPQRGDRVVVAGTAYTVQSVQPFRIGDELVRIEIDARGGR